MLAEIITIGDEILIGQIVDSNSAFISKKLNEIGVSVCQITSIRDDEKHILEALEAASKRADLVITTGGLGPTKDDITKHTLCTYFNDYLVEHPEVLKQVTYLFEKVYQKPISEMNKAQAFVPSKAVVLKNAYGTAPGIWVDHFNTIFVSLPGVPYEMKALITDEVLPRLKEKYQFPTIIHKTLLTQGMGESMIAERAHKFEDQLPTYIKLAYLPSAGRVRLRLSGKYTDRKLLEEQMNSLVITLKSLVSDIFVGFEDEGSIEQLVGLKLSNLNYTLATAESCTGGAIAQRLTQYSGASNFYKGSVVCYATDVKTGLLAIPEKIIEEHSVVSTAVAEAMATAVKNKLNTDYAIATTGNAGPSKGESDKDVGTVCIAVAHPRGVYAEEFYFGKNRERVINKAVNMAFQLLLKEI